MGFKRYKSVENMIDSFPNGKEISKHLRRQSTESLMANFLFILRNDAKLSQEEIAKRSGLTQSAVSKMENGGKTLSFNDIVRYVAAAGHSLDVSISQGNSLYDKLQFHVSAITGILEELSELAGDDAEINVGVLNAFKSVLVGISEAFIPHFTEKLDKLGRTDVLPPHVVSFGYASGDTRKRNPIKRRRAKKKDHQSTASGS